ncbi:MAG: hypothetical protein ABIY55_11365 [Kofleriaceae bacterium]
MFGKVAALFPTDASAAKAMGCDRSRVAQLRGGAVGQWITRSVVDGIRAKLHDDPRALERLTASLLSEPARAALRTYDAWNDTQFNRRSAAARLYGRLRNRHANLSTSHIEPFANKLEKRGFREESITLAILKALEPLAEAEHSGGIEMTLDDLAAAGKLGAYLTVALKREDILLGRTADPIRRAQEITAPKKTRAKKQP